MEIQEATEAPPLAAPCTAPREGLTPQEAASGLTKFDFNDPTPGRRRFEATRA